VSTILSITSQTNSR